MDFLQLNMAVAGNSCLSQEGTVLIECEHCDARVDTEIVAAYTITDDLAPAFRYSLVKCPRCQSPILATQVEDFDDWGPPQRLYPSAELSEAITFPKQIREAYDEARLCLKAGANTAAAIMCRKALEAMCREHSVEERTLAASLLALKERGIVEQRLYEWAEALRDAGNEAAHDVNITVSAEDASDLLAFTLALGEYLFTFRDKFEQFKKRRMERGGGACPSVPAR